MKISFSQVNDMHFKHNDISAGSAFYNKNGLLYFYNNLCIQVILLVFVICYNNYFIKKLLLLITSIQHVFTFNKFSSVCAYYLCFKWWQWHGVECGLRSFTLTSWSTTQSRKLLVENFQSHSSVMMCTRYVVFWPVQQFLTLHTFFSFFFYF